MKHTRRFAEALGSWMHFEACCFRAGLFSESSFKAAIGSVASSLHGDHKAARVHADYPLPAIQRVPVVGEKSGGGRKKNVDFALIYDDKRMPVSEPQVLIEAKWAGSSHCTVSNLMADFVRLSLMKRAHPDAVCLFVLAGHVTNIDAVLLRRPFKGERRDTLPVDGSISSKKFKFLHRDAEHQKAFSGLISAFHSSNLNVPIGFSATSSGIYPPSPAKFKAIAWEVLGVEEINLSRAEWPVSKKDKSKKAPVEEDIL
ncbi:hypothetical protein [Stenotrophomonas muris]